MEQKESELARREQAVTGLEAHVREQDRMAEKLLAEARGRLEETAGMTAEEAKRHLIASLEEEARHDAALLVKRIEDEARETAEKKARHIVTIVLERVAGEHAAEISVSAVSLPSDEMKGRIIGREGRNIRAFETAAGVDLVIDDTPEAVLISCFDPVRREIARVSLGRLVADGRIHPARIEEVVEKVRREVDQTIREEGEKAAFDLGIHDLHPEVIKILGRLKYRTSYGQNVLDHSKQVAYLCGMMAAELGANEKLARRVGLLHDLGKSISHEVEGDTTPSAPRWPGSTASPMPSSTVSARTTRGKKPAAWRRSLSRRPTPSRRRVRGAARHPGDLCEAAGEARRGGPVVQGRREGLRHPGRPGDPDHRQAG